MAKKGLKVLRFDLPYSSEPPELRSEAMGFASVVERSHGHCINVTVIDSEDHRLLRAGVVVAHRKTGEVGEWYLSAPTWQPWLPPEHIEALDGASDLPEGIARRITPFTRRASISPVAGLECVRREYTVRDLSDQDLFDIRDEQVGVRRNRQVTSRYREVTITPKVKLSPQQREYILASMVDVSASVVDAFPSLQQRIGPPATGLSDFSVAPRLDKQTSMEDFVTAVFAGDLQQLVEALLAFEVADEPDVASLSKQLEQVRRDVRGLATVLEPQWRDEVEKLTEPTDAANPVSVEERAIDVVDALVVAARAPKLGDTSHINARSLLFRRAERAAYILADRCRALTQSSPNPEWLASLQAAEQLHTTVLVALPLLGKRGFKAEAELQKLRNDLAECIVETHPQDVSQLSPQEAFEYGQAVERELHTVRGHRIRFVDDWPRRVATLRQLLEKVAKKI